MSCQLLPAFYAVTLILLAAATSSGHQRIFTTVSLKTVSRHVLCFWQCDRL